MKNFKIYIHSHKAIKLPVNKHGWLFKFFYKFGLLFLTLLKLPFLFAKNLIRFLLFCFQLIKQELRKTSVSLNKRKNIFFSRQYLQTLLIFLLISAFTYTLILAGKMAAIGMETKNQIVSSSYQGLLMLNEAKNSLKTQNLEKANQNFTSAYHNFQTGQDSLSKIQKKFINLTNLLPQTSDAKNILQIASIVAQSGKDFVNFYKQSEAFKLSPVGITSPDPKAWHKLDGSLKNIESNLTLAVELSKKINPNNLPREFSLNFLESQNELLMTQKAFSNFSKIFKLFYIINTDQHTVLLVFQNNNELRTTGGFLGTFGTINFDRGQIVTLHISSIYDLDGQLRENIIPPTPILNLNSRWFLRDSNWFVDFAHSSEKITQFYEKEGGETPDMVLAITPNVIMDVLKITGPIEMPKYNLTLTSENFLEHIQLASSVNYIDITPGKPKQVLADLVLILIQKLQDMPKENWPIFFELLQKNLNQKNILASSRIEEIQEILEEFNWAGRITPTDRDYLQISTSNLGGTKSDIYIKQNAELKTFIQPDGSVISELEITRQNTLPKAENTKNTSYVRILVPLGSKLLFNTGFEYKFLENQKKAEYKTDPDVYEWEKGMLKDVLTGTVIGEEGGKTFFANWQNLEGGETKTIRISYVLPFKLKSTDRYSLIFQKQPGVEAYILKWHLNFKNHSLAWQNFTFKNLETNSGLVDIITDKDQIFGIVATEK